VGPHYVVCNGDESEPGTFKDRVLMEMDPFAVIESLSIAGFACGATQGTSTSAASIRKRHAASRMPSIKHAPVDSWARGSWRRISRSTSRFAGRGRLHLRRGDRAAELH